MPKIYLRAHGETSKGYFCIDIQGERLVSYERIYPPNIGISGSCSVRKLGLVPFLRKKALVAVFAHQDSLKAVLWGRVFSLSEYGVVAMRSPLPGKNRFLLLGAKVFVLKRKNAVLASCTYWDRDFDDMGDDIFQYAERVTENEERKIEFLAILDTASRLDQNLNDKERADRMLEAASERVRLWKASVEGGNLGKEHDGVPDQDVRAGRPRPAADQDFGQDDSSEEEDDD